MSSVDRILCPAGLRAVTGPLVRQVMAGVQCCDRVLCPAVGWAVTGTFSQAGGGRCPVLTEYCVLQEGGPWLAP